VAARRAEPEEHELDLLATAVATPVLEATRGRLGVDRVAHADADHRRPEVANLALAATQERDEFRRY
jgi:hypothetical protein